MKQATPMTSVLAISVALFASTAEAYSSGNELLSAFESDTRRNSAVMYVKGVSLALAEGYMLGVMSATPGVSATEAMEKVGYCLPTSVTVGQVADVVRKYLQDNPATRHQYPNALIKFALSETFPCVK